MEIYLTVFYIFNLGGGGSRKYYPPRCWFFFNNSNGKSCSPGILEHSVTIHRDICAEFGIPNSPQSPDIGQNSDGGISDFWISGQFFVKENCHNSRTSDDIHMKLGPVTKLDKRNKATSKKIDDDVMSANCDVMALFPIYGQFGDIRRPDSGRIVCKVTFSLIVTFYFTKPKNRAKKSLKQLSLYCFE